MFNETTTTSSTISLWTWVDYTGIILLILFIIGWYYFARFKTKTSRKWIIILFFITFVGGILTIIFTINLTNPIFFFVGLGSTFMSIYVFWILYRTYLHPRRQEDIKKWELEEEKKKQKLAAEAIKEGQILYDQALYKKANEKFIEVIKWDQNSITAWIYLAKIQMKLQKVSESRYFLKHARRIDPENEEVKQLQNELEEQEKNS